MKVVQTLFTLFVTVSSAAAREEKVAANPELSGASQSTGDPGDGKPAGSANGSANARLRA